MTIALPPLTHVEHEALHDCEAQIERALADIRSAWKRIGAALARIHDGRLYREFCDTFEAYVEQRWSLPRSSAYEWMDAAGVVIAIESTPVIIDGESRVIDPPARIGHARELSRLPAREQAPALHEARTLAHERGASEPTTYEVKRVVTARLGEPLPRSNGELAHERKQRALCDLVRRVWGQIDEARRTALLSELNGVNDGVNA
jgi:hypothetical protein